MRVQGKKLEAERAALIAELEATLAPDIAHQVEAMLEHHTRHSSIVSAPPSRSSSIVHAVEPTRSHTHAHEAEARIDAGDNPFDVVVP